jgi:hypothetical protein
LKAAVSTRCALAESCCRELRTNLEVSGGHLVCGFMASRPGLSLNECITRRDCRLGPLPYCQTSYTGGFLAHHHDAHLHTHKHTSCTSRGFGWRIHCGVEVTELTTNKQHTLTLPMSQGNEICWRRLVSRQERRVRASCGRLTRAATSRVPTGALRSSISHTKRRSFGKVTGIRCFNRKSIGSSDNVGFILRSEILKSKPWPGEIDV